MKKKLIIFIFCFLVQVLLLYAEESDTRKLRPEILHRLKLQEGKHNLASIGTIERQTYEVATPVQVVGVRGADELKLEKEQTIDDLVVDLEYIVFSDEEIDAFIETGRLNKCEGEKEDKRKYRVAKWLTSEEEEIQTGEATAQVLINTFKKQNRYCSCKILKTYPVVFNDNEFSNLDIHLARIYYLNLLLQTIAEITTRPELKYKIDIFYDEKVNAFTTTSGYMFISEEFLNILENEDELAAVLCHEISHITLRHHSRGEAKKEMVDGVMGFALEDEAFKYKIAGEVLNKTLIKNSFSRADEYEADKQAVTYLINLGYNPYHFISVLEKFENTKRIKNKIIGSFLNNHPEPQNRIDRIKKLLEDYDENSVDKDGFEIRRTRFEGYMRFGYEIRPKKDGASTRGEEQETRTKNKKNAVKKLKGFLGGIPLPY
ncbi:MAG: M48 family metallopeptidase [Candidatus Hydrogenedentota bacterium]